MTTALATIITGLQALKVIGLGQQPDTAKAQYCLRQLNGYLAGIVGFGGSLPFRNIAVSGSYTIEDRWPVQRIQCLAGGTVFLPQAVDGVSLSDGMRIEVVDASNNASAVNITIDGNGWLIDGDPSATIDEDGGTLQLLYRSDRGGFVVVGALGLNDPLPYPADLDEAIALNAAKRYTLFGQALSAQDMTTARAGERKIRSRYAKVPPARFDPAISRISGDNGAACGSLNNFLNGIEN